MRFSFSQCSRLTTLSAPTWISYCCRRGASLIYAAVIFFLSRKSGKQHIKERVSTSSSFHPFCHISHRFHFTRSRAEFSWLHLVWLLRTGCIAFGVACNYSNRLSCCLMSRCIPTGKPHEEFHGIHMIHLSRAPTFPHSESGSRKRLHSSGSSLNRAIPISWLPFKTSAGFAESNDGCLS